MSALCKTATLPGRERKKIRRQTHSTTPRTAAQNVPVHKHTHTHTHRYTHSCSSKRKHETGIVWRHQKQQPETRNKFAHLHRRFVNDNNVENYTRRARKHNASTSIVPATHHVEEKKNKRGSSGELHLLAERERVRERKIARKDRVPERVA